MILLAGWVVVQLGADRWIDIFLEAAAAKHADRGEHEAMADGRLVVQWRPRIIAKKTPSCPNPRRTKLTGSADDVVGTYAAAGASWRKLVENMAVEQLTPRGRGATGRENVWSWGTMEI